MDREEIRGAALAAIAAVAAEADVAKIRGDAPLRAQVRLDSMDWLNVLLELRDRLGVDVAERDAERIETLDDLVDCLAERPPAAGTPLAPPAGLPHATHRVNGRLVTVRPIRRDDEPLEADFVRHLSPDNRYSRFMATIGELPPAKLRYLTDVDQVRHVALVATVALEGGEAIVGVVRYIADPVGEGCEFSIALDDAWHRSGLAGILMRTLMDVARSRGLKAMQGVVLAANAGMLHFAHQLGFALRHDADDRTTVCVERAL